MKFLASKAFKVLGLASCLMLLSPTSTQAAPPPPGYPTSQIMAQVSNSKYGNISIRRGFYDATANKGWGMDKAWHKHNLHSINAQKVLMRSPNGTPQGNGNIVLKTYVGKYSCSGTSCKLEKQIVVNAVYAPNDANFIQGWRVGGKVGLLTAYCDNDDRARDCPEWVTYSLDNPGKNNPYSLRNFEEPVPSSPPTGASSTPPWQAQESTTTHTLLFHPRKTVE